MKAPKAWLSLFVSLALLLGAVYGIWWLLAGILSWVMTQPSQVAAAIIAFSGTVIAGIGAVVISQQRAKAREIAESHRPNKTKLYTEFITQVVGIMRDSRGAKKLDPAMSKKREAFFFDFTTRVMLWGSPGVLQHYGVFRRIGENSDPNILLIMDDILQAMRKDLGLSNWGLARGDLIKMLLTDPESLDGLIRKNPVK